MQTPKILLRCLYFNLIVAIVITLILHIKAEQIPIAADIDNSWQPALHNIRADTSEPLFCFVVRTYWGHGDAHGGGLRRFLRSLQRQQHQRWEAVILVADSKPFPDLHHILLDLNDTRSWVFAEWIGSEFAPKQPNGAWAPHYHGLLYNLTDDAIQVCPPETQWLVVTNGDNEYGQSFITRVLEESSKALQRVENLNRIEGNEQPPPSTSQPQPLDIIAFDFYSRFQRITMPACDRFAAQLGSSTSSPPPLCKRNHLKWCQTDLGAAALHFHRFQTENRKFGDIVDYDPFQRLLGADSADGVMMETLVYDGWKVAHVTDACLFVHAPSIQSCAWQGGVWDDRDLIKISGGKCLTEDEAAEILKKEYKSIEQVLITVSNDANISREYQGVEDAETILKQVPCLRRKNYKEESVLGLTQVWYSEWCVDKEDEDEFRRVFDAFYPTEEAVVVAQEAAQRLAEEI